MAPEPDDPLHFGVHLTLDGYGGARARLADFATVRGCLRELPELLGMHKLIPPTVLEVSRLSEKDPGGLSGYVLIAESHIAFTPFRCAASSAPMSTPARTTSIRSASGYFEDASRSRTSRPT